ncbi:MAG: hypothetical protein LQ338_005281 [Usnochroma carphineum]|nr:MAG: hypothetical protein LQ338_005281 [Usnochroma carphineum]
MTQDTPPPGADQQETVADDGPSSQRHAQDANHLRPSTNDSASDNETGERPVREKLKKTSIASMPRNEPSARQLDTTIESISTSKPEIPPGRSTSDNETPSPTSESRGRLSRKRSYDDTVEAAGEAPTGTHHDEDDAKHARKRSRDVRAAQPHVRTSSTAPGQSPPEEEPNSDMSGNDEATNQETERSAQSPRKKRSRQEFDVDAQRGQKIAATDEAKAFRRSEDSERGQLLLPEDKSTFTVDSNVHEEQQPRSEEPLATQQDHSPRPEQQPPSTEPLEPQLQKAREAPNAAPKASQKAPTSFASSGFAALANSSKSPFGTLGSSTSSVFRSTSPLKSESTGTASKTADDPHKPQNATTSAFGNSPSPFLTSAAASAGPSGFGFAANGAATKPSGFGGSVFGSSFVNKAAAAPKLTSFAAPTGNLPPPKQAEPKAFGAHAEDSEEEEAGSEGEANTEEVGAGDEVDSRFQQQEVETGESGERSIFTSSRAQLYYFDGGGWHEKGKGAFKLNVAENADEKKARFIMRAHQTFRVLLNQPVFKKMQVGDSKGREPSGKNFAFAVIDQGRPTPHLLKLSDENESKTLYREILRLQQDMETQS